ncbi:hypothetical protein D7B24_007944 [Verticillium nonalfalfae]|uniref:Uncharacterized protein n=1 Tax=Verticillium nonalfalfae TaxID=1051616 RepID=A0A3M9Y771_9PEZI|nr:uncharacterized protein D7B24_007944 [Verticillium nonalfalfae]RNJ55852.1 hypothetical protein D7B24_007944 [Verticillium nonalfalfae]
MAGRKDDGGVVKKAVSQKRKVRFEDDIREDTPRSDSKRLKSSSSSSSSKPNPPPLSEPDQLAAETAPLVEPRAASPAPEAPADLTPAEQRRRAEQERRDAANEQKSPVLPTPRAVREAHIKKEYAPDDRDTAELAAGMLNLVSLAARMSALPPGDAGRYSALGYIIKRLDHLDLDGVDARVTDLTPAQAAAAERDVQARLQEAQAQQRKLFNTKNTKKYAAGLRRFVADPPAYRREVAARCGRIFIHDSYARAFVKWLRQLDRAARLECRYFHAVNWAPRKVMDGETEVWVV